MLRGVIESLTSAASAADVVVGVDDVHLLDDLSTYVVHQVVQRGAAKVILTARDGEPIPPAVQEIWRIGQFDRVDLRQLSLDETATLLSAVLDGPVDSDAAARLWKLTDGNVLYPRNIVAQEVADGRIAHERGFWRWMGDPVMPPGLVDLIESRIGALPASVSDVIDVLAVGEPLELAAPTRITDAAAVEEAEIPGFSSHSSPQAAESRCGWRIRSTARSASVAHHAVGCDGCADRSPPNCLAHHGGRPPPGDRSGALECLGAWWRRVVAGRAVVEKHRALRPDR